MVLWLTAPLSTGYTPNMLMLMIEVATLMYGKSARLTSYWYVPYKIVQQHTGVTFKIRKDKETKTLIVHDDRLRLKEQDLAVDVDKCNDSSVLKWLC